MSLLLSPSLKCSTYIFGSSGDINPDPMRESLPRKDHQNSHNHQEHPPSTLPDLEVPFKDVKHAVPVVLPIAHVKTLERSKEYTTKDKILQVQNGEFILNTLKSNKKLTSEPQQMTSSEIRKALNTNYKKHHDGTLEMINQHLLKRQKQVLGFLVKKFGSALFKGKSMSNISLPVTVFESQSQLEREVRSLCYAPHFLEKGGSTTDTLEQFKLALTQFISTLHLETTPQKAFIPTLGETFQGIIGDCPVYVEQISCHPAKYALQMLGKNFTMEEVSEFATHMSINSVKSYKIGKLKVIYKNNNTVIRAQLPPGLTSGIAMGKRTFQVTDKCYVFDIENKYYAEISFDSSESSLFKRRHKHTKDQFSGAIWKINDSFADKLSQAVTHHYDLADVKFKEKDHVVAKLEDIEGSWLESLKIGDRLYWSFGDILPFKLQYAENPLPSDSNFRLDILHLRANDEVKSETYKEMLEENQRKDSKLREQSQRKAIKP